MAIAEGTSVLRRASRRAYELGRFRGAILRGAGALILALPAYLACGRTAAAAACLATFVALVVAARFRGEGFEDGSRAGMVAGIVPCLFPAALRLVDPDLCDVLFSRGPWLCGAAGVAAGLILGLRSRTRRDLPFWATAIVTLAFAATLGCIPAGTMGLAGLAIGVAAGGLPAVAARRISA